MADAEQKQYKSYTPQGFAKLSPHMKNLHDANSKLVPKSWGEDFDVSSNHDEWVNFTKNWGDQFEKAMKEMPFPTPDSAFGDSPPYKKTVIAPIDGVLSCECTVFEPNEDAKNKLMFIYVHGGGMAFLDGKGALEWTPCNYAIDGHIGATVHFTNSTEECYPRGLNDTISAIKYLVATYKDKVKGICLHGESGGGNLIVAAMLKMKQEEPDKDYVDLLYAECPYLYPVGSITAEKTFATPKDISGAIDEFTEENETHGTACLQRGLFLTYKGPEKDEVEFLQDKFAWPYFATEADLKNFPVTYVQDNECDQLKDIGLRFYRQLLGAGVQAYHTVEGGTFHAGEKYDMMYNKLISKRRATVLNAVLDQKAEQAKAAALAKEE